MDAVETFEVDGLTVSIHLDDTGGDGPRDWDNLGTMVCWHRRYQLGDEHEYKTPQDFMESDDYKNAALILPLGLYDHSGITMYIGSDPSPFDPGGWDSGQVGFVYVTREKLLDEYSCKRITKKVLKQAENCVRSEVAVYDQFLTGDVYGYVIEDKDGRHVDSCWGFYGMDDVREQARGAAQYAAKHEQESAQETYKICAL